MNYHPLHVIIIWPLLGPISAEPVSYTDIAGSCKAGKIATRLAVTREAAANVGDNTLKEDPTVRTQAELTALEYQIEIKKN